MYITDIILLHSTKQIKLDLFAHCVKFNMNIAFTTTKYNRQFGSNIEAVNAL
jgi:hypothetical protein